MTFASIKRREIVRSADSNTYSHLRISNDLILEGCKAGTNSAANKMKFHCVTAGAILFTDESPFSLIPFLSYVGSVNVTILGSLVLRSTLWSMVLSDINEPPQTDFTSSIGALSIL